MKRLKGIKPGKRMKKCFLGFCSCFSDRKSQDNDVDGKGDVSSSGVRPLKTATEVGVEGVSRNEKETDKANKESASGNGVSDKEVTGNLIKGLSTNNKATDKANEASASGVSDEGKTGSLVEGQLRSKNATDKGHGGDSASDASEKAELGKLVDEALHRMKAKSSEPQSWKDTGLATVDFLFTAANVVCASLGDVPWVGFAFTLYTSGKNLIDTDAANSKQEKVMTKYMKWLSNGLDRLRDPKFKEEHKDEVAKFAKHIAVAILTVRCYGSKWMPVRVFSAADLKEGLRKNLEAVEGMRKILEFDILVDVHNSITELRSEVKSWSESQTFIQQRKHAQGALRLKGKIQDFEGLKEKVEEVSGMLKASGGMFAFNGMGGIGKTTLAAAIYDDEGIRQYFDYVCWVEVKKEMPHFSKKDLIDDNIVDLQMTDDDIVELQKSIYRQLTGIREPQFECRPQGESQLRGLMDKHKVLLVLDNIWKKEDSPVNFPPPSKSSILLTTRNNEVARAIVGEEHVQTLQTLNDQDSLELLRKSAKLPKLTKELKKVLEEVVSRCGQLPLALSVLGGMAAGKSEGSQLRWWENQLKWLKAHRTIDHKVNSVLQQSFSAAPPSSRLVFLLVVAFLPTCGRNFHHRLLPYLAPLVRGEDAREDEYMVMEDIIARNLVSASAERLPSLSLWDASRNDAVTGIFVHDLLRDVAMTLLQDGRFGQYSFSLSRHMLWDTIAKDSEENTIEHLVVREGVAIDWPKMSRLRSLHFGSRHHHEALLPHILELYKLESLVCYNHIGGSISSDISALTKLTYLVLEENSLEGQIPRELSALTNLAYLTLSINQLSGIIPPQLSSLTDLTYLNLSINQLSGTIPPVLSALTSLTALYLYENQLSGSIPPELSALTNLTILNLSKNQLGGSIPPELSALTNLRELYLSCNKLSGSIPPDLSALTNLRELGLSYNHNHLSGSIPPELSALTNLRKLDLVTNQLSGSIPPELSALKNLTELYLFNNQLSGSIPPALSGVTNLRKLNLFNNQLSGSMPPQLSTLTNLKVLDLSKNQLSGSIPPQLSALTNLTHLNFSKNQLCGSIIPSVLSAFTSLTALYLSENQLSGSIPPELSALTNLTILNLSENQLSCSIPPELSALTKLNTLNLSINLLSGSIPPELSVLTNLKELYLSKNQLSGSIPPELSALTNLTALYLSKNQLSGSIPVELSALSNLTELYLFENQLSGSTPPELSPLKGWIKMAVDSWAVGETLGKLDSIFFCCDGCGINGIVADRHKSIVKHDYDLCGKCLANVSDEEMRTFGMAQRCRYH